jgi:sugar/nucleoside kinase (ribokinase family)
MMKRFDVFVGGHLTIDMLPGLDDFQPGTFLRQLKPGKLLYVDRASFSTGGPVSNTGLALHGLGLRVCILGKVGSDDFGQAVRRIFKDHSPELSEAAEASPNQRSVFDLLPTESEGTSYSICLSPPQTDRMFLHYPGANDSFGFEDINYDLVARSKIFHFGYPPLMRKMYSDGGQTLANILAEAKKQGAMTSLDMALPDPNSPAGRADWIAILEKALSCVDLFAPSFEELLYMLDRDVYLRMLANAEDGDLLSQMDVDQLHQMSDTLLGFGAKLILIKLGDRGIYLRTASKPRLDALVMDDETPFTNWADQEIISPCFKAAFKGALGAGDATIAGFLAALVHKKSIHESLQLALGVGACCVEEMDPISGIPHWDGVCGRIDAGWQKHKAPTLGADWQPVAHFKQWKRMGS